MMQFVFETLAIVVLSLAAFLLVCLIVLNLYLINKNGFYVNANCWFCNTWTKVLYQERNSFNCPNCTQYNGFREDGSYNKIIEAQHNTSLTKFTSQKTEYDKNGLCTYCNNNQQLKIYQLAKFTPLNEDNYDLEIEHFRKQLEKAYKLCKKCEQVLKTTLNTQHSWIFGNRLKDLRRKGFALLNPAKVTKQQETNSIFLRILRYTLIVSTIFILCHILNIRIVYPHIDFNKYIPKVFNPYKTIVLDYYRIILHEFRKYNTDFEDLNHHLQKNFNIHVSYITAITNVSLILDLIVSIGGKSTFIWKTTRLFSWIVLMLTSSIHFQNVLATYVFGLQLLALSVLLYSYIWSVPNQQSNKSSKEYHFKKLSKSVDITESSEEDTDEEIVRPLDINSTIKPRFPKSRRAYSPVNETVNTSFNTAKSVTSTSELYNLTNSSNDLNRSLDNLHLSFNSQRCTSPIYSVSSSKRPILSPAKLKNITQNPWTAGGFWKSDANVLSAAVSPTNLSRSSSQSSGFVSQYAQDVNRFYNSLPASREHSLSGDGDRVSILSEPAYHFSPISPNSFDSTRSPQLYYKTDNNTFYPVLNQNNMLFIHNGIPQQNFTTSSLRRFDMAANSPPLTNVDYRSNYNPSVKSFDARSVRDTVSPGLHSEQPVSRLFKNLQVGETFRRPQC